MDVPLSRSDYFRGVAKEARVRTRNRFFETNPILTGQNAAMIARPGMKRFLPVGLGPIRGVYSQAGAFSDAAFVASDEQLYRIGTDKSVTLIGTIPVAGPNSFVSMVATSNIGTTPAYLFVAAGSALMLYVENGYAIGTITGAPANNDTVTIGAVVYKFTTGSVNAGTPAGTLANPWLVALGSSTAQAWANFSAAIDNSGTPGTQYSTALTAHTLVKPILTSSTTVQVRSTLVGALGNATATTETGAAINWGAATLAGGGAPSFVPVETPDNVGIISLGYIGSYVIAVPAQGQGINGRFFWIEPGETTIDDLNFATAERAPDPISGVAVFGDQFWLPGVTTTEAWYITGNFDSPVARVQGVVFDRGAWEGTAIQVKDSMFIVDNDGAVFKCQGGAKRISRPDIEQRIREAIMYQAAHP